MQQIDAIIWDWGRVLGRFSHEKIFAGLREHCEKTEDEIHKLLYSNGGPARRHETGALQPYEFYQESCRCLDLHDFPFREFCKLWQGCILGDNPAIGEILSKLRPEIRQVVLSNTDPLHWPAINELPLMKERFTDPQMQVLSFRIGNRKPEQIMWNHALFRLGIMGPAQEHRVLYVDDIQEYTEVFAARGGRVLTYNCETHEPAKLEETLRGLGAFV